MQEERQLIEDALSGKRGSFEALVRRHQKLVWHLVYRMVQNIDDAHELCQEVFLRVHGRLHQFRFESTLATWIGRIAFSISSRHLQRKHVPLVHGPEDEYTDFLAAIPDKFDLQAACENSDLMGHMMRALETLPPIQRTVITLFHLEEISTAEIARITELPEGTVKSHLFRARARLRDELTALTKTSA